MTHHHKRSKPHVPGTTLASDGSAHPHLQSTQPDPPNLRIPPLPLPTVQPLGDIKKHAPKAAAKSSRLTRKIKQPKKPTGSRNTSAHAADLQGDYAGIGAFAGLGYAKPPRKKTPKPAVQPPDPINTRPQLPGSGSGTKKGKGGAHTSPGVDSRNYTAPAPGLMLPEADATPYHTHKR